MLNPTTSTSVATCHTGALTFARALLLGGLVLALWRCLPLYFASDDHIQHERWVIAALFAWHLGRRLKSAAPMAWDWRGAWIVGPAAAGLVAAFSILPSKSLANYCCLGYASGLIYMVWGAATFRRCVPLFMGAACMVYPPQQVFAPMVGRLLVGLVNTSWLLCRYLVPAASFHGSAVDVGGQSVDFVMGCSGNDFMMTYAALTLVIAERDRSWARLAIDVAAALTLGFALNVARVVTMIAMTQAGYGAVALDYGHLLLGEAFVFVGIIAILLHAERNRTPRMLRQA